MCLPTNSSSLDGNTQMTAHGRHKYSEREEYVLKAELTESNIHHTYVM